MKSCASLPLVLITLLMSVLMTVTCCKKNKKKRKGKKKRADPDIDTVMMTALPYDPPATLMQSSSSDMVTCPNCANRFIPTSLDKKQQEEIMEPRNKMPVQKDDRNYATLDIAKGINFEEAKQEDKFKQFMEGEKTAEESNVSDGSNMSSVPESDVHSYSLR